MQITKNFLLSNGNKFGIFSESDVVSLYNSDCNNCVDAGIYFLPPNTTHAVSGDRCVLLVFPIVYSPTSNTIHQIYFNVNNNIIYYRFKNASTGNWTVYQIDETAIS